MNCTAERGCLEDRLRSAPYDGQEDPIQRPWMIIKMSFDHNTGVANQPTFQWCRFMNMWAAPCGRRQRWRA